MERHRPTLLELTEEGKWVDASPLVKLIDTARQDVEVDISTNGLGPDTARAQAIAIFRV